MTRATDVWVGRPQLYRAAIIVAALALCDWSELVVGERGLHQGIGDSMHEFFAPANAALHTNPRWANAALIAISGLVDLAGVGLLLWSIFGKSIRPFIGLLLLYGMRQTVEALCAMPPPEGMIWRYPGFPSLLVNYDVTNDFYFSGHTAMIVYATAEMAMLRRWLGVAFGLLCVIFVVVVLFSLRAHYTMDVFAGGVAAVMAMLIASIIAKPLDRWFSR